MFSHQKMKVLHLYNKLRTLSSKYYLLAASLWTTLTLYLSLISARAAAEFNVLDFIGFDKLAHLVFYIIFAFLWSMGLRSHKKLLKVVLFFSISFGVLMEIFQLYLFNGRSFELYDIIANTLGSIIGVILFKNFIN